MDNMVFYNHEGKPIAYCEDKEKIYLFSGEPVAYFYNGLVYGYVMLKFYYSKGGFCNSPTTLQPHNRKNESDQLGRF